MPWSDDVPVSQEQMSSVFSEVLCQTVIDPLKCYSIMLADPLIFDGLLSWCKGTSFVHSEGQSIHDFCVPSQA